MAKTLAEIGYSIRNQIKGYFSTDDERISIEFIYAKAWDIRSMLIKEEYRKFRQLNDQDYISECCLEVCCDETVCEGEDSLAKDHYVNIPTLESALGYNGVKYFGTTDKKTPFRRVNYPGYLYSDYESYTKNVPTYTLVDTKAFLKNLPTDTLKFICIIGIFENPRGHCDPEDAFPIARHLVHKLELIAVKQLMSTIVIGPDEVNNARDDSPAPINQASKPPGQTSNTPQNG